MNTPVAAPSNDKLWTILCHLSLFLGVGFILPLIVYLVKKQDSDTVAAHAREVLNFHISVFIYVLCSIPFVFILVGVPMILLIGLVAAILSIIGALRASEGILYHYPVTIRLIQ